MSSEMVLANILNQEGKIGFFTTSWWYSTEIETIFPVFYRLGLFVFPHNWYAARVLGQAIMMALLVLSYLYVGHGFKLRDNGAWGAAVLMCPFSIWYVWYGTIGAYQYPYMIMLLISLGAILHLAEPSTRIKHAIQWILLIGSSFLFGITSIKGLMIFYLPMGLATFVLFVLQWREKPEFFPRKEAKLLLSSIIALVVSSTGYLINSTIIAEKYQFLNYNNQVWVPFSVQVLLEKWWQYLSVFGYPADSLMENEVELFSFSGLLGVFGLVTAGAIVFSIARLLWRWKELKKDQLLIPLLFASAMLIPGMIFTCMDDGVSSGTGRWLTAIPFAFMVLQLEGETEHFHLPFTRKIAALAFCVCFVATSAGAVHQFPTAGYVVNPHLETVCDWLADHGYTQGYASFWNANVVTEWSNGQVDVWVAPDFKRMDRIYEWLQKTSHKNPPEGKIFLLTTDQELTEQQIPDLPSVSRVVYEEEAAISKSGRYIIMEYDSVNDMMAAIDSVKEVQETAEAQNPSA